LAARADALGDLVVREAGSGFDIEWLECSGAEWSGILSRTAQRISRPPPVPREGHSMIRVAKAIADATPASPGRAGARDSLQSLQEGDQGLPLRRVQS
jgi:hypothetical protein